MLEILSGQDVTGFIRPDYAAAFALGACAALAGARLLVVTMAGIALVWAGSEAGLLMPLPDWVAYAALAGLALGLVEAVVVVIGGRASAANFWGGLAANLVTALIVVPARTLRGFATIGRFVQRFILGH